jgi:hypothetical protein
VLLGSEANVHRCFGDDNKTGIFCTEVKRAHYGTLDSEGIKTNRQVHK